MAQLDNPRSIALLFTGAFVVSLAIIAFLNVEMESRSTHGAEIRSGSVFERLGKKISDSISSLKERNAYRRSVLYSILISGNGTRFAGRRLLYFVEKPRDLDESGVQNYRHNRTLHRLRHEKKMRRLTQLQMRHQRPENETGEPKRKSMYRDGTLDDDRISVYLKSVNNQTLKWVRWMDKNEIRNLSRSSVAPYVKTKAASDVLKEKFSVHENCYTMNDVLEIIAITCLVNFIFWFLIITCVNIFTRNQKITKSDSCESLASIGMGSDYEVDRIHSQKKACDVACPTSPIKSTFCRHSFVQDYVNSLIIDGTEIGTDQITGDPGSGGFCRKFQNKKPNQEVETEPETEPEPIQTLASASASATSSRDRRRRTLRFVHLPNVLLDMISLDNVKPFGRRKANSFRDKKQQNLLNSLSMENLIF